MNDNGKPKFKVLVTDKIDPRGLKVLSEHPGIDLVMGVATAPDELKDLLPSVNAWLVRSETKITAPLIALAKELRLIGRAGVGVDNIDVADASRHGIAVINAPAANTISACEHTWGLILALARNIPQADRALKEGGWDRSKFMGVELDGKTLGVVGLGRIGREVGKRGKAFGMRVIAYDPFMSKKTAETLGAELMELEEVLEHADYVSLHVPVSDKTRDMINKGSLAKMKNGARLINCARGELIDVDALVEALAAGSLKGAALDVYKTEPLPADHVLRTLPNVILTPHLGASTTEAQMKVAEDLSEGVLEFLEKGLARNSINLPGFDPVTLASMGPTLSLADTLGRFIGQLLDSGLKGFHCRFHGDVMPEHKLPLSVSALKGVLSTILDQNLTFINAPLLAQERGIETSEASASPVAGFDRLITITAETDKGEVSVSGRVDDQGGLHLVRYNGLAIDVCPQGRMLVLTNQDEPGMIGKVGALLGENKINIADMRVGRSSRFGEAVMVITVDDDLGDSVLPRLQELKGITSVRSVIL